MNKKIYLFCSAGMSTSLLANKMQSVANNFKLPVEVEAYSYSEIDNIVKEKNPNCILLGPQVKYMLDEVKATYDSIVPVAVIDSKDYGAMDGEKVLKMAVKMIKERSVK
ncbi:PTS sugar transporter subunit IIB [Clostridioides sp. ZZV15-6598]|uniref:PTS sugar transporter subunit IIB n=1 Tax=Clostridioides sp. ZZV15-6598 TaxID=2811501 RepID=UPI001D1150B4|nr:PTS sugar transporter subunit IIB [Clostridioides sp. ZZV15-6598]